MTCSPRVFWCFILTLGVLYRLALAAVAPPYVDEAYALTVASTFSWSFFDHPPLSFWAIDAMYRLTGTTEPFVLRIPSLILGFGTIALVYSLGAMVGGPNAGRLGAVIWTLSPYWSRLSAVYLVPDAFLSFFSILCVWFVARTFTDEKPSRGLWVGAGLALAAALASKYHAVLLVVSALLFAIFHPRGRAWFKQSGPYIACAIGLIGFLPVLLWNLENDWASFRFHGGRIWAGVDLSVFYAIVLAELRGLVSIPVAIALVCGAVYGLRHRRSDPVIALLLFLSLPMLVFFHVIFLGSSASFEHWTMPGWLLLLPLAGVWLTTIRLHRLWIVLVLVAQLPILVYTMVLFAQARTDLLDPLVHAMTGGTRLPSGFDYRSVIASLQESGHLDGDAVIAIPGWVNAGYIGAALRPAGIDPSRIRIVPSHLGRDDVPYGGPRYRMRYEPNHFRFMAGASAGGPAIYINPVPYHDTVQHVPNALIVARQLEAARRLFPDFRELPPIIVKRGNTPRTRVYMGTFTWPDDPR